jgi:hypothetical protein
MVEIRVPLIERGGPIIKKAPCDFSTDGLDTGLMATIRPSRQRREHAA